MSRRRLPAWILTDPAVSRAVGEIRAGVHELQDTLPEWVEVEAVFPGGGMYPLTLGVKHNLGRRATRYVPVKRTTAAIVYDGTDPTGRYPEDTLFLTGTAAGTVTLLIY